jgi:F-box/leucine-rich repeat protein 2/20
MNSSSSSQQMVSSYLPDECWESIFTFINDDDNDCNNNRYWNTLSTRKFLYWNSLSLVSKQFLSITNRLIFSLTVLNERRCCLFKRFTNLNSLILRGYNDLDLDKLLCQISHFPLKLTSLHISYQSTIPANGLRSFSQKITTLTSLTCSDICSLNSLNTSDLFLIAECFPLLEQLDLSFPSCCTNYSSYVDGVETLSLALIKLRKVNLSGLFPINNQSLFHLFNNCKYLEEVIMFCCNEITSVGLASALRERPTLRSLSFSTTHLNTEFGQMFATSHLLTHW